MSIPASLNRSFPFGATMRYRTLGDGPWRAGEIVEIARAELMFFCEAALEVNADVEVLLPATVQVMGHGSLLPLLCAGRVVRRFLVNWPEIRPAVVVRIAESRIACEADYSSGAAVRPERHLGPEQT